MNKISDFVLKGYVSRPGVLKLANRSNKAREFRIMVKEELEIDCPYLCFTMHYQVKSINTIDVYLKLN